MDLGPQMYLLNNKAGDGDSQGSWKPHPSLASIRGSLSSRNWKFWLEVLARTRKLAPHPGPEERP